MAVSGQGKLKDSAEMCTDEMLQVHPCALVCASVLVR